MQKLTTIFTLGGISQRLQICRMAHVTADVFWNADTTIVRMLLALGSLVWAGDILYYPGILSQPPYQLLGALAPEYCWVAVFLLHTLGVFWRIFDPHHRPRWALLVNSYGLVVWVFITAATLYTAGGLIPGFALEVVACLFGAWALLRTSLGREVVTP